MTTLYTRPIPRTGQIVAAVAEYFGLNPGDITGQDRHHNIVHARMIAAYLIRSLRAESLPQIGIHLGDRDHTTILHAVRKITWQKQTDELLRRELDGITRNLMLMACGEASAAGSANADC